MKKQELNASLHRLQADIDRLDLKDPEAKEKLEDLAASLTRHIEEDGDAAQADQLLESLSAAVTRFEVEHPSLTAGLSQVMLALSSMGI